MDGVEDIEQSLEPIAYLTRSPSRIRILDALDNGVRTRDELVDTTDVSRFTVSRTLAEFEDRGWTSRSATGYSLTGEGSFVICEVRSLLSNVDVAAKLDGTLEWLQTDELDVDIARFRDANVYTPSKTDHTAHIRVAADAVRNADRVRGVVTGVSHEMFEAVWEAAVHGSLDLAGVLHSRTIEAIHSDGELSKRVRELIREGGADIYEYKDGNQLVMLNICDETVYLCGHDEDGPAPGTIETEDAAVHSWATSYFDTVRAQSTRLDPAFFAR